MIVITSRYEQSAIYTNKNEHDLYTKTDNFNKNCFNTHSNFRIN